MKFLKAIAVLFFSTYTISCSLQHTPRHIPQADINCLNELKQKHKLLALTQSVYISNYDITFRFPQAMPYGYSYEFGQLETETGGKDFHKIHVDEINRGYAPIGAIIEDEQYFHLVLVTGPEDSSKSGCTFNILDSRFKIQGTRL